MPIDLAQVNWVLVAFYSALVFVASFIGNMLTFQNRLIGAVLSALLFAAIFVGYHYYPHGINISGLPTPIGGAARPAAP
jgi:hypothetical protein